jgi:hypothetical protein
MLGNESDAVGRLEQVLNDPDARATVYMPHIVSLVQPPLREHPRVVELFRQWRLKYYGR